MGKVKQLPSQDYLNTIFNYDENTGLLYWKPRPLEHFGNERSQKRWNTRYAHTEAGGIRELTSGYRYRSCAINRVACSHHRIIWKMLYNEEPEILDHLDRNATNNIRSNLVKSSDSGNSKNRSLYKSNKSGIPGVRFDEAKGKWVANIRVDTINRYLMTTDDFFQACCARKSAERKYGFSDNHGDQVAWYHEESSS